MLNITLKELLSAIAAALDKEIQNKPNIRNVIYSDTEAEAYSFLRDQLFRTDDKTEAFFKKIKEQLASPTGEKPRREVSEAEFGRFIHQSLEKFMKGKDSEFKLVSHYFSPDNDLIIRVADKFNFESQFRVLVIKTS